MMMRHYRAVLVVYVLLALSGSAWAQSNSETPTKSKTLTSATCPGTGCFVVGVSGAGGLGIQVSGTFSGTLNFKGSVSSSDCSSTAFTDLNAIPIGSTTPQTSTTSTGVFTAGVGGLSYVCVVFSSYSSGSAAITTRSAPTTARSLGGGGGGGGSGTVTSIATTSPITGGTITTSGTIACANCGVKTTGLSQFAATTSAQLAGVLSDETGSGLAVFATSPTLTTPNLGTPSAATLTNATGLPIGGLTGLGTGVGTFLATPSSANLAAAITDETGSGLAVFATSPTLTTPVLGVATGTQLTLSPSGASGLTVTGATETTNQPLFNATQTWNNGSTVFDAFKIAVTDTASSDASSLFKITYNGDTAFRITKYGGAIIGNGSDAGGSAGFFGPDGYGLYFGGSGVNVQLGDTTFIAGTVYIDNGALSSYFDSINTPGIVLPSAHTLRWMDTITYLSDLYLNRGGAAILELGNDVDGTAVSQSIRAANGITGTNRTGGNLTLMSGVGTGSGAISSVLIQTPTVLGSGTTAQTLTTRVTIDSSGIKATGYKSSDGSAGITGSTCTAWKNGLCTSS